MALNILVQNNQKKLKVSIQKVKKTARTICTDLKLNNIELSILLVDDKEMQSLNCKYRNVDKSTDVLSFPQISPDRFPLDSRTDNRDYYIILGDVVISAEKALSQAKSMGCSYEIEFCRLLIHGILHLTGYDHESVPKKKEEEMKAKEGELFKSLFATL